MSLTYSTLKTQILAETFRTDLGDTKAADFVRQAEGIIARRLRATEMIERATLADGDRVSEGIYTLPAGYLEERALFLSDGTELEKAALSVLRKLNGGVPVRQYAPLSKTEIEFRGVPSATETIELIYFARPTAFSADLDTNLILTDHEIIYLAAAKSALYEHTQDLELSSVQGQIASDAIETLNEQAGRLLGGGQTEGGYNLCSWGNY